MLKSFQELDAWKKAHRLALAVYTLTRDFPREERFALVSQLRRAAASVGANIAEGFGRRSTKDFLRYLEIASGSLEETRHFLILSQDLAYLNGKQYPPLNAACDEVGRLLGGLARSLRKRLR
ncbi:MAG: four helix bundle protein [Candidatus Acidoferrales bacterium]